MFEIKSQLNDNDIAGIDKLFRSLDDVATVQHPLWPDELSPTQEKKFFLKKEGDEVILSAKVIESRFTRFPFIKFAHIPYGPFGKDGASFVESIKELFNYYKESKFANFSVQLNCDLQQAQYIERTLLKEGLSLFHGAHSEFKATIILPLLDDIDKIYGSFSTNLKRNITKAKKNHIRVSTVDSQEEFKKFPPIYEKMESARSLHLFSSNYLNSIFEFIKKTQLGYFLATYNEQDVMIGGMFLLKQGRAINYIIGATDPDYKHLPQSHLTFFEAIKLSKKEGFEIFDFGGYAFYAKETDQVYDINRFKLSFTDKIIFYPRALSFIPNRFNGTVGQTLLKVDNLITAGHKPPKKTLAEPLRILLVTRTMAHGGGAESLVYDIFMELKKWPKVKVKLLTFQKSERFNVKNTSHFEEELSRDPDFHFSNSYVNLSVFGENDKNTSDYERVVGEFKPNIIHSHLFIAEITSREMLFPRVKYFTHTHDNMHQLRNLSYDTLFKKELITNYYEKLHLVSKYIQCNNHFISISVDTDNYFERVLPPTLSKNIYRLDNAINTKKFNVANNTRNLDKIRIVNVGSFQAKKNQRFLLDIAEVFKGKGLEAEIVMLGDGLLFNEVKAEVERRWLQNVISMPGNVVNVTEYYGKANVYVHTAYYEPFGLVLIEAMAAGLPVVTLDGKGNRELIKDGINGFMIYEQDASKFADRIAEVVKDRNSYQEMSDNAVEFAAKYDIKEYVNKLLDIYKKAE